MYYNFVQQPEEIGKDTLVASATNGVVYVENNRLHISTSTWHLVYKWDGTPIGWYVRNLKTNDDIYLGDNAAPCAELETISIIDEESWQKIVMLRSSEEEKEE